MPMYFRGVSLSDSYGSFLRSTAGSTKDGKEDEDGTERVEIGEGKGEGRRSEPKPSSITRETKRLGNCTRGTERRIESDEINKDTVAPLVVTTWRSPRIAYLSLFRDHVFPRPRNRSARSRAVMCKLEIKKKTFNWTVYGESLQRADRRENPLSIF